MRCLGPKPAWASTARRGSQPSLPPCELLVAAGACLHWQDQRTQHGASQLMPTLPLLYRSAAARLQAAAASALQAADGKDPLPAQRWWPFEKEKKGSAWVAQVVRGRNPPALDFSDDGDPLVKHLVHVSWPPGLLPDYWPFCSMVRACKTRSASVCRDPAMPANPCPVLRLARTCRSAQPAIALQGMPPPRCSFAPAPTPLACPGQGDGLVPRRQGGAS